MNEDRILLVDDEPHVLKALTRCLLDDGYRIETAQSGDAALELAARRTFKVVISDERMPGMCGSEFLTLLSLRAPQTVRILLTGHASIEAAMSAVNEGQIYRFLVKPWDDLTLRLAVRSGIEKFDLEMENRRLLAIVRTQGRQLVDLEERHPGAVQVERGRDGSYRVPELNEDEIEEILRECAVETRGPGSAG
ncbi:response regulator [Geothermobacter hydrogeniphilus]|uniref:Response regulator n=1 Tax=Geothermobacter hydrogeniphilus TaxID=1969733 RepID=A0A1X0YE23_9BACT|nr:response regulator [Geothermobacter hydrogeniphilus]ORJ63367.1 response regulator [Geothermobacter hydrogeniphilus]